MEKWDTATLAGGCFWCTEAIFRRLKGISSVEPGYAGGNVENPTYDQVSSGNTGHAEAIQIKFNPKIIPYKKLLEIFFNTHDPTTPNQQGNDFGPQYRSVIFFHNSYQKKIADSLKIDFQKSGQYSRPIVTEIAPYVNFYLAENYHKNYYENHKDAPYCTFVINPKLNKLIKEYASDLKEEYKSSG